MTNDEVADTECSSVLRDVWLFLDDEMDEHRRATVQRHLDDCSPCLHQAGLDRKLKELLARTCGGDRAPEDFRVRLTTRLHTMAAGVARGGPTGRSVTTVVTETLTVTATIDAADPGNQR